MLPQTASQPLNATRPSYTPDQVAREQAAFLRKVFAIMSGGLATSAVTALVVAHSPALLKAIFGNGALLFYGLLLAEIGMVALFSRMARNLTAVGAAALFYVYAIVNGLTLSVIFLRYTQGSIVSTLFVCAGSFAGLSAYGFITKRDLTGMGAFMIQGLIGLIGALLVSMFFPSPMLYLGISVFGVIVFAGLTAYDVQKLKAMNVIGNAGTDEDTKEAIHGALILYLDFVNLFLFLLRLFGRRR